MSLEQRAQMTHIYFVRHAEADKAMRDGRIRPLTGQGSVDAERLVGFWSISSLTGFFQPL